MRESALRSLLFLADRLSKIQQKIAMVEHKVLCSALTTPPWHVRLKSGRAGQFLRVEIGYFNAISDTRRCRLIRFRYRCP